MKKILFLSLMVVSFVSLLSCAPQATPTPLITPAITSKALPAIPEWQKQWEQTLTAAKKEGQVAVYTLATPGVRTALEKAFKDKYGIELSWVAGTPMEVAKKLSDEKRAGLHLADAVNVGGGTMLTILKPAGILAPLQPLLILPEVKDDKSWWGGQVPFHDKEGTGLGFIASYQRYVLVNTAQVKETEITSYYDLLKPRFKGQIVLLDPTMTGTGLSCTAGFVRIWGLEQTKNYLGQLVQQEPIITRDKRQQVEWVARGKYAVALAADQTMAAEFIGMGSPLAYAKVREKSKLAPAAGVIAVVTSPSHPNATTIFINWLLSREGQTVAYKAYAMPSARTDVAPEGILPVFLPGPGEEFFLQDEEDYLEQGRMMDVNKVIFSPLLK